MVTEGDHHKELEIIAVDSFLWLSRSILFIGDAGID